MLYKLYSEQSTHVSLFVTIYTAKYKGGFDNLIAYIAGMSSLYYNQSVFLSDQCTPFKISLNLDTGKRLGTFEPSGMCGV
jgi:hypothetical protein